MPVGGLRCFSLEFGSLSMLEMWQDTLITIFCQFQAAFFYLVKSSSKTVNTPADGEILNEHTVFHQPIVKKMEAISA